MGAIGADALFSGPVSIAVKSRGLFYTGYTTSGILERPASGVGADGAIAGAAFGAGVGAAFPHLKAAF